MFRRLLPATLPDLSRRSMRLQERQNRRHLEAKSRQLRTRRPDELSGLSASGSKNPAGEKSFWNSKKNRHRLHGYPVPLL